MDPKLQALLLVGGWLLATTLFTALVRSLARRQHPLAGPVRLVRGAVLFLALAYSLAALALDPEGNASHRTVQRVLETLLWLAGIAAAVGFATQLATVRREGTQFVTRFPKLLLDILRLILVLIGACFVVSGVWSQDLSGLLTALGVSSIVLGLALQNTLDNVMVGIAVLFERPFQVGDWITVGSITGEVMEMNWRSVRVRTRSRDMVVIPNSVIGKETLVNMSRPTKAHAESHVIGFSYDDPPNKVKRVLMGVVRSTRGVLADPAPAVRTVNYAAYSIEYQVRFFLDDYPRVQEINDEFMTRVWYAAKRNGLNIPFPIQTSFEYHGEMPKVADPAKRSADVLAKVPVFVPLDGAELAALSHECEQLSFGRGERIVFQGEPGDAMYVILAGTAIVTVADPANPESEREVARLSRGEFFGEMALLTGEPRSASVTAVDDLDVVVVHKQALEGMLHKRPGLAQEMAEIVEARKQGLRAVRDLKAAPPAQREAVTRASHELLGRIRNFFGL
ncbi:MAG: mechanosensitive ion channel [Planctomycetes bacterium]|nr:mechanosensitive ion channel [Planctomycetota bacterium]